MALLTASPAAPVVALAAPATTAASTCLVGLIDCAAASPSPSASPGTSPQSSGPCVLGVLLCGGNVISQPTPCVGGLLCAQPSPAPCVGSTILCQGAIIGPGTPPSGGTLGPSGGVKPDGPGGVTSPGLGTTNVAAALGLPPGVSLIGPIPGAASGNTPNPDGFSALLSLSIRDGLAPGGSQLWPALAMLQAVLLLVIVGAFAARRVLEASKPKQG